MSAAPILLELQRLARAGLVELDPRVMIDVVRIIDLVGTDDVEALAHSLASRLTHEPRRWRHVADALIAAQRGATSGPQRTMARGVAPVSTPGQSLERGKLRRTLTLPKLPRSLRELSGARWLVVVGVLALVSVAVVPVIVKETVTVLDPALVPLSPNTEEYQRISESGRERVAQLTRETLPTPEPQIASNFTRLEPVGPPPPRHEAIFHETVPIDLPGPAWLRLVLMIGSLVVLALGVAWWSAPGAYRRLVDLARNRARAQREAFRAAGHVAAVPYHVEQAPPFSPAHIDDAATVLGRLFRREPGRELDLPASITATAEAGGRMTPVFTSSPVREHVLVFVDLENRSHPYLEGVEWVLARWRRLGLRILRYDYHHTPESLLPERGGPPIPVDVLGHQTEGLALLLFSRMRGAREYRGRLPWARHLQFWPVRAWLDLDPTGLDERERDERRLVRLLEAIGLPRYPFNAPGLLAAVRGLADGFPRHRLVPERPLPPAQALDTQLLLWAACAACVPDASWAQLDAVRRHFDGFIEVGEAPLDARAIERLLEWVAARDYGAGLVGEGARLYFTAEGRRALIRRLRAFDRARWPAPEDRTRHFEARARQLLIDQLRAADLGGEPYETCLRDLKIAVHEAILDPERAGELLPGFGDRAVAYEMRELVADELAVQSKGAAHGGRWSLRDVEALQGYVRGGRGARLPGDLLRLPRSWRQVGAFVGLAAVGAGSWALWFMINYEWSFEHRRVIETPPTWKVVTLTSGRDPLVALADVAPMRFAKLPGGTFEMGSTTSERRRFAQLHDLKVSAFADEGLHTVEVSGFELGTTEVTNAQWKAVMGSSPSDCRYGCDLNHPVHNVTWEMAVDYLNRLTDRENLKLAPVEHRTRCYERRGEGWTWVADCTGYRLPTEAEWEYAARAGTRTAYYFAEDPKALCKHGNGADQAARRAHPDWSGTLGACDDGTPDLAWVGRYGANPWGLYDMHGNVWEWTWDWYEAGYGGEGVQGDATTRNPRGPTGGDSRVLRGGSFKRGPWWLRSAARGRLEPTTGDEDRGLRCARGAFAGNSRP